MHREGVLLINNANFCLIFQMYYSLLRTLVISIEFYRMVMLIHSYSYAPRTWHSWHFLKLLFWSIHIYMHICIYPANISGLIEPLLAAMPYKHSSRAPVSMQFGSSLWTDCLKQLTSYKNTNRSGRQVDVID